LKIKKTSKSFICIGPGGSGKSEKLKAYYDNDSLVLTLTNKACDSLRKKGLEEIYTFDTYFREKEKISDSIKKIQIDEFSMMPTSWLIIIYKLKLKNPNLIVQLYGDPNQCKQVCKHNRYFDYLGKKCVSYICDNNVIRKKYIEATARYDKELYEVLEYLLETGKMHPKLDNRPINHNLQSNIVKHNNIRDEINKKFANEWFIGMKIIGNKFNDKSKGIFNSKLYYITDIKDNKIKYTDDIKYLNYLIENKFTDTNEKYLNYLKENKIEKPIEEPIVSINKKIKKKRVKKPREDDGYVSKNYFLPAYACTVYKYQGDTIEEPFNIHETSQMDRNELYTAISRAKKLDQIHIDYSNIKYIPAFEPRESTIIHIQKPEIGYIYHLYNNKHNKSYIGKTTNTIEKRLQEHLNKIDDPINKYDGEWKYEEISKVYYFKEKKLNEIEKKYIVYFYENKYDLINTQNIPNIENEISNKISIGSYDEKIKEQFKIEEGNGYFRIRCQLNKKKVDIKKAYGPRKCREEALKAIQNEQSKLISSFSCI
jgi:hypothetical protein